MQTARFRWYVLISLIIHTVLLCLYGFIPPFKPRLFSPIGVDLLLIPSSPRQETSGPQERPREPAASTTSVPGPTRTKPLAPSIKTEVPSREGSSREVEAPTTPGGTPSDTGFIAPGSEGIPAGSGAPGAVGTSPGTGGPPTETKGGSPGSGGTSTATKGGASASEKDAFSGVEIPAYVRDAAGFRSSHNDGGIYPEIDSYVLFGGEKDIEVNVPGTEVCVEGDQLRTKERMTITEVKTDYSKCRYLELGDDVPPKVVCPPEAQARLVHINHYASSPLVYSVRTCLQYDQSHCYNRAIGTGGDDEWCRVDFRYEGMWAEGTIWAYKCTKSEARTYRHSLQYNIRWIMEVEIDNRLRKRQIYRETRSVPPCN